MKIRALFISPKSCSTKFFHLQPIEGRYSNCGKFRENSTSEELEIEIEKICSTCLEYYISSMTNFEYRGFYCVFYKDEQIYKITKNDYQSCLSLASKKSCKTIIDTYLKRQPNEILCSSS
jgi:hypothetical protein